MDPEVSGRDPDNPYRLYFESAPSPPEDKNGKKLKMVRDYRDIVCPIFKRKVGYFAVARKVFHIFCMGDIDIDPKSGLANIVPQQKNQDFVGKSSSAVHFENWALSGGIEETVRKATNIDIMINKIGSVVS